MAKYPNRKIDKKEKDRMLMEFCQAFVEIKKTDEAAEFLKDLLGPKEVEMLALRMQIAKLLIGGTTYQQIRRSIKVSENTIARVAAWLDSSGEGFRLIISRIGEIDIGKKIKIRNRDSFKRKYPMYFWPELLIEEIVSSASRDQKKKILRALKALKKSQVKPALYKQLSKTLNLK